MTYTIFLLLAIIPIGLYSLFALKFNANHKLTTYYIIEMIIVLILTSIAQFYFYKTYHLNLLPSQDQLNISFGFAFIFALILFIGGWLRKLFTKKEGFSMKGSAALFLVILFFFVWIIPLGQKYDYVKRLDTMEEIFDTKDFEQIEKSGDISIAFIESGHDRFMKPRRRSPAAYSNFFYIQNTGDSLYTGHIYLTVYDKDNNTVDLKLIQDIEVEPDEMKLLMIEEDNTMLQDEWNKRSFKTKKQVYKFDAKIIFD